MTDNGLEIKKDTFIALDQKGQNAVIYDYLNYLKVKIDKHELRERIDKREIMLVAGLFGFLGGAVSVLAKFFVFVK